jgi:hypothetical protein
MTSTASAIASHGRDLDGLRVPKALQDDVRQVLALTSDFCHEYLDEEYAQLCRRLVGMLARKRPSPLARGDLRIWAAVVIYTVGANNFLFDQKTEPYLSAEDLASLTGVPKSTMANKARSVRHALAIDQVDVRLCRRDVLERHPYAWYVELNGLVLDVRDLPSQVQEEARRMGLVPDLSRLARI